jgi:hypothetical protein
VRQALGVLSQSGQAQVDVESVKDMHRTGRQLTHQPSHAVAAVGQHCDPLGHRQVLRPQNLAEPPSGLLILASDKAEVAVQTTPTSHTLPWSLLQRWISRISVTAAI